MTVYAYKAMDLSGRAVLGRMDAFNLADLEMRLKRMELDLIRGNPVRRRGTGMHGGVPRRELINFCFHLEQLTSAGVPILEALTDLRDSLDHSRFREVVASMIESIEGGRTLSQAMAAHPRIFDGVFVSLVKAGEDSGKLPEVLRNLRETLKWQDELAAHTKKLVLYPAFLCSVVIAAVFFMMIYLVPKMTGFIKSMGHELPLQTRILIEISGFFVEYWQALIAMPIIAVVIIRTALRLHSGARDRFDSAKLRLPMLGDILRKIILSRFAGVFAMMYASGISIIDSIRATEDVVGNAVIRNGLKLVGQMIADGQSVTAAFQNAGLFPPLVIRMLRVGENSGKLDAALLNVGYFYNRDVRESVERVQAIIEPAMILVVGLILGWVMLSVLGPIYDIIATLKT